MDYITVISLASFLFLIWIFVLVSNKRFNSIEKALTDWKDVITGVKMRVLEQESRQLGRPGIYVDESMAKLVANVLLALLTENEKEAVEKEYNEHCHPAIPLWKYVIHNYSFELTPKLRYDPKKDITDLSILNANLNEDLTALSATLSEDIQGLKSLLATQASNRSKMDELEAKLDKIEM